jgi:hypothetical protein
VKSPSSLYALAVFQKREDMTLRISFFQKQHGLIEERGQTDGEMTLNRNVAFIPCPGFDFGEKRPISDSQGQFKVQSGKWMMPSVTDCTERIYTLDLGAFTRRKAHRRRFCIFWQEGRL